MRFAADACTDGRVVRALRALGADVAYAAERPRQPDEEVLKNARSDRRVLITMDTDFADLVFARRLPSVGVILIRRRMSSAAAQAVAAEIAALIDGGVGVFTVLDEAGFRQRPLP